MKLKQIRCHITRYYLPRPTSLKNYKVTSNSFSLTVIDSSPSLLVCVHLKVSRVVSPHLRGRPEPRSARILCNFETQHLSTHQNVQFDINSDLTHSQCCRCGSLFFLKIVFSTAIRQTSNFNAALTEHDL